MLTNYTIEGFENIQYQGFLALQKIENKLSHLFSLYGYHQVSTPTFEAYDLLAPEDAIPSDELFKLVNHQGKVLALKPDATLPIARMAAINHHDSQEIIKFCYRTNIYRNFASPDIVKKEITQMGVEYFGNPMPECDGEIIALAISSLLVNGIEDIHIDMGHVGFIGQLFDAIGLTGDKRTRLLNLIETKNLGDIRDFLSDEPYDDTIKETILKMPLLYGDPQEVFTEMDGLCLTDGMRSVVAQLRAIYKHLEIIGLTQYITFDLGFTSRMNYYTDLIFKVYVNGWGEPVIGGGRYDDLSARFGIDRPACGFAIDILQLMDYMEQNDLLPADTASRTVILYDPGDKCQAFDTAAALRAQGHSTEVFQVSEAPLTTKAQLQHNQMYEGASFYYISNGKTFQFKADAFKPIACITEGMVD